MDGYFPRYFWPVPILVDTVSPLSDALYARFETTTLHDKLTEFYNTEAIENAVMPYGTFALISSVPDWTFTENFEDVLIQFMLFSEKPANTEIIEAYTALKAAFDFFDLVIAGHVTVSLVRESAILLRVEGRWQYDITYRIVIQN